MDGRATEHDQADAAGSTLLLNGEIARADPPVLRHARPHRRLDDAIPEPQPPDRTRLEEMRIRGRPGSHGLGILLN